MTDPCPPARPGHYTLMARATDARGRTQRAEWDPHRGGYLTSHIQPIEIEVRSVARGETESDAI